MRLEILLGLVVIASAGSVFKAFYPLANEIISHMSLD
jgi:hypothetical protein